MTFADLVPGMAIIGPTGTVYTVQAVSGDRATLKAPYWVHTGMNNRPSNLLRVDQVALDRFQPLADPWAEWQDEGGES